MKHNVIFMNLAVEMLQKNMTYKELAELCGLANATLRRKIHGDSYWLLEECIAVKKALGSDLPIETMFERKE